MWTREQLKMNAKEKLRLFYWSGLAVSLIYSFIGGGFGVGSFSRAVTSGGEWESSRFEYTYHISPALIFFVLLLILLVFVIGMVFTAFLVNPLAVGVQRFYLMSGEKRTEISEILFAFKKEHYWNVVKIMFLRQLYVLLWTLLFLVPGMIKSYEYYMIPYLLAENPNMGKKEAFNLTREMTDGEKWGIFVLELSFFGWLFLGALLCGIGTVFVMPYMEATFVELFLALKAKVYYSKAPQQF